MNIVGVIAVSQDFAFGDKGGLPWNCPEDLKRFKERTMGKMCIVGRKTAESLPTLPGRTLLVVGTGHLTFEEAIRTAFDANQEEVLVIGGAALLDRVARYLTHLDVTVIKQNFPDADTRSPMFGNINWNIVAGPTEIGPDVYNVLLEKPSRY